MSQSFTFNWPVTVYYEDTDAGGVVYHSNYLNYFERARTEMLRSIGVNQQILLQQDIGFVVRHIDIDFFQAARLDEQLTVLTFISEIKRVSLTFAQEVMNSDGQILSKATVKVACVKSSMMKPTTIPQFIITELTKNGSKC